MCPGREPDLERKSVLDMLKLSYSEIPEGGDIKEPFRYLGLEFERGIWDQNINVMVKFQPLEMILYQWLLFLDRCSITRTSMEK